MFFTILKFQIILKKKKCTLKIITKKNNILEVYAVAFFFPEDNKNMFVNLYE